MGHIQLSRSADLVVVAPATADLMAQDGCRAGGRSGLDPADGHRHAGADRPGDERPHVAAPRDAAQPGRNCAADGIAFVGPNEGSMACGEFGPGRMAEPDEILAAIERGAGRRGRWPASASW